MDQNIPSVELMGIIQFVERESGIVFNDYNSHLIRSRMDSILKTVKINSIQELHNRLCIKGDQAVAAHVIDAITTNETFWFRDQAVWSMIESLLLPQYVAALRSGERQSIKIWSAACSYGQEPYSMAMCIDTYLRRNDISDVQTSQFEILATDISAHAIKKAEAAKYDSVSMTRGLEEGLKHHYFSHDGRLWRLHDHMRNRVLFQRFNLVNDRYRFDHFDLILCRNVLIYFSEDKKREIYASLSQSLRKEGVLLIGSSELIDEDLKLFSRQLHQNSVYFKKKD